MKTTLTIETKSRSQTKILLEFLSAMGIRVSHVQSDDDLDWQKLGLQQMEKEWSNPANDHWDEFFKNAPKMK